jgi:elongation factor P--beta-lysine ligase
MHRACAAAILSVLVALAQPPQAALQPPPSAAPGLEAAWDIAPVLQEIGEHAGRLLPALDRIDARAWVEQGASETYAEQLQLCKEQAKTLAAAARDLARNPEQLASSIDLFIRLESLDVMLLSLQEGIRKYQAPADAQALAALEAQDSASRERFERYIVNLANAREQELKVMDREAQRCRGLVTAPSAAPSKPVRKK